MVCCKDRPYLCPVLTLCAIALGLHIFGVVAPGWIMVKRDVTEIVNKGTFKEHMEFFEDKIIDEPLPEDTDDRRHHHPHHGPHHGPHHPTDRPTHPTRVPMDDMRTVPNDDPMGPPEELIEEERELEEWFSAEVIGLKKIDFGLHFGLWNARACVKEKDERTLLVAEGGWTDMERFENIENGPPPMVPKEEEDDSERSERSVGEPEDRSSSEDDDDKRHHKKKCHCKKISIRCALSKFWVFEDPLEYLGMSKKNNILTEKNYAYATIKEHRIEMIFAAAMYGLAFLSGIVGFKKNGCRCAATATVLLLLIGAFLSVAPVIRFGHYSMHKHNAQVPVYVHPPMAAVATGTAIIVAFIAAMVAACGAFSAFRKQRPGRWYQFNNELELPVEEEKKTPQLVFMSEPLPPKPGMEEPGNM